MSGIILAELKRVKRKNGTFELLFRDHQTRGGAFGLGALEGRAEGQARVAAPQLHRFGMIARRCLTAEITKHTAAVNTRAGGTMQWYPGESTDVRDAFKLSSAEDAAFIMTILAEYEPKEGDRDVSA